MSEFTSDQLVALLPIALERGDMKAVDCALRLLAVQDPHRAQLVVDTMKLGIAIREVY